MVFIFLVKWWNGIQKLCAEFGIKLILDEVVCGFYRTGRAFGFTFSGETDFICMARPSLVAMCRSGAVGFG